jgi:tRNA G18 (ribose-2'-O)-methylase SpoU
MEAPPTELPPRLKRAESVLRLRTERIALVLEHSADYQNIAACLRTAESFGVQDVFVVRSLTMRKDEHLSTMREDHGVQEVLSQAAATLALPRSASKAADSWVTLHMFESIPECITALRADGREIWVTDLNPKAELLAPPREVTQLHRCGAYTTLLSEGITCLPKRLAIVMGRESDGISPAFRAAADKCVFIPMVGFAESFNLSVATALVLQRLFDICPEGECRWMRDRVRCNHDRTQLGETCLAGEGACFGENGSPNSPKSPSTVTICTRSWSWRRGRMMPDPRRVCWGSCVGRTKRRPGTAV